MDKKMAGISQVKILLVEDNPGHARLIQKNIARANIANEIQILDDGQKAIDYFFDEDGTPTEKAKDSILILLDLNLPGVDGYQVLERIKTHEATKHIPVIILTTTDSPSEMERCYELGCNIYITKPVEYEQFSVAIQRLGLFLLIATLPEGS
jgi:CheY-like chemotaxis protein